MSAASDKARFYLEQYVPELQEYERKEIFSRDEITAVAKKRSDFEHILNASRSRPADYVRYATYEMNLDSLRKKRCKRLGVKSTTYSGQRTIFFIMDRATKKFPGDMGLWMQYVQFCQKERANKKLAKVFTSVLRLKPRDWGLWVLAAKHYAEVNGDMSTARSFMQRGLRFCKDERKIYLEYAKLEMVYLAKLAARRKILGLDEEKKDREVAHDESEDMIALPDITAEDIDPDASKGVEEVNADALKRLANAPAYTGAIPKAIFAAAMKQFKDDSEVAGDFFDLVASFDQVPSTRDILNYIYDHIKSTAPAPFELIICEATMHTFAIPTSSAEFPGALSQSLSTLKSGLEKISAKQQLRHAERTSAYLLSFLEASEKLDEGLQRVLGASGKRYLRVVAEHPKGGSKRATTLVERLPKGAKAAVISMSLPFIQTAAA